MRRRAARRGGRAPARAGEVHRTPGYDGEYGVIRLFEPGELAHRGTRRRRDTLFDVPATPPAPRPRRGEAAGAYGRAAAARRASPRRPAEPPLATPASPHVPWEPMLAGMEEVGTGLLDRLDSMQRVAASAPAGPLLVVAGPGTGKTRTLTHRIAYLCAELERAARASASRSRSPGARRRRCAPAWRCCSARMPTGSPSPRSTPSACGSCARTRPRAGLEPGFAVADEAQRAAALAAADGDPSAYTKLLREQNLVDLDELTTLPVALLRGDPGLADRYHARWRWVFVDEYQDVDATQYELLRLLVPADGNICAIGDPDQAIYSFRGADVGYFLRFAAGLHRRPAGPAGPQLPLVRADHRGGVAGDRADLAGTGTPPGTGPAGARRAAGRCARRHERGHRGGVGRADDRRARRRPVAPLVRRRPGGLASDSRRVHCPFRT